MFLSKLELDIKSPSVRQALINCQDMHRNIMKAFNTPRSDVSVLYRLCRTDKSTILYVQSMVKPDWEKTAKNGFICTGIKDLSTLEEKYGNDSVFRFTLFTMPFKKVRADGKNSKRVFLRTEQERMEWLKKQGDKYGFYVLQAFEPNAQEDIVGIRNNSRISASGVVFEGILKVMDAEAFWNAYKTGIGPEKAYGMGMLMLSRANK